MNICLNLHIKRTLWSLFIHEGAGAFSHGALAPKAFFYIPLLQQNVLTIALTAPPPTHSPVQYLSRHF